MYSRKIYGALWLAGGYILFALIGYALIKAFIPYSPVGIELASLIPASLLSGFFLGLCHMEFQLSRAKAIFIGILGSIFTEYLYYVFFTSFQYSGFGEDCLIAGLQAVVQVTFFLPISALFVLVMGGLGGWFLHGMTQKFKNTGRI